MPQQKVKSTVQFEGTVTRQLFDSTGKPKPQFKDNFLWQIVRKMFKIDLRIPFITGVWTTQAIKHNVITTVGKQLIMGRTGGTNSGSIGSTAVTGMALGTGTPGATALGAEITTNGGGRAASTVTNTTTTTTGDTEQWAHTFTFTGGLAITEEGLFDSNSASSGNMLASQTFSVTNVVNTDTLAITHQVKAS